MIEFLEFHGIPTAGAFKRVVTEGGEYTVHPAVKGKKDPVLIL